MSPFTENSAAKTQPDAPCRSSTAAPHSRANQSRLAQVFGGLQLDLIVEQNNAIRQDLATLQQAVNSLPEQIVEIFRSNWLLDKTSAIDGVVKRFNQAMTTATSLSLGYQDGEIQEKLQSVLEDAEKLRTDISGHQYGRSFEIMVHIGGLMTAEIVSHRLLLEHDISFLATALYDYDGWINGALIAGSMDNVAAQVTGFRDARDRARSGLFTTLQNAARDGGPLDGVGAARCISLREYRVDVKDHKRCGHCYSARVTVPKVEPGFSLPVTGLTIKGLSNRRLAAQLSELPDREGGFCCERWKERTPVWGSVFDGEKALVIEEYNHPSLPVQLLTVTLYDRREQAERCELIGLDGAAVVSTDEGCAANQEWRSAHVDGAVLRSPVEMLREPNPDWPPGAGGVLPSNFPTSTWAPLMTARSCSETVKIDFGVDQFGRSGTFGSSQQFVAIERLAADVGPLVDETNGQQLMYLAALTTAAGLSELKARIVEEIQKL